MPKQLLCFGVNYGNLIEIVSASFGAVIHLHKRTSGMKYPTTVACTIFFIDFLQNCKGYLLFIY